MSKSIKLKFMDEEAICIAFLTQVQDIQFFREPFLKELWSFVEQSSKGCQTISSEW